MTLLFIDPFSDSTTPWGIAGAGAASRALAVRRPDDDSTNYITSTGGGAVNQDFVTTKVGGVIRVNANPVVVMRGQVFSNAAPGSNEALNASVLLGGVAVSGPSINTTLAASPGWETQQLSVTRPGGGAWTAADITSSTLGLRCQGPFTSSGSVVGITTLYLLVDVTLADRGYAYYGSRRLRLRRLPGGLILADVPTLEFLDHELLDLNALSHPELPSADARGAGVKPWERWPVIKIQSEVDLTTGHEIMTLRDMRSYIVRHWDIAKSLRIGSDFAEGIARLDVGTTRTWTRPSQAWVYRADKRIIVVGVDSDKHDFDGDLFESASANMVTRSSFKTWPTGSWVIANAGVNGSAVAADTSDNLFSTIADGSNQSVKLTAGNPLPTVDTGIANSISGGFSFPANTALCVSVWHKDDSGAPLFFQVSRGIDSFWWNDAAQTWGATPFENPLPVASVPTLHSSRAILLGTSATNASVVISLAGTVHGPGVAGQINHVYHVQVEQRRYPSSAIVTDGVSVTRSADALTVTNNTAGRSWPEGWGTFRCKVRPWWDSTTGLVSGDKRTIAYVQHDANNYDWLYYDATAGGLKFERKAGGVSYVATKTIAMTQFSLYNVAVRWTGAAGELNLPPYTISVFAWPDSTSGATAKGTDATAAALVWAGTSNLEIGSQAGLLNFDGNIWAQEVTQQALSDAAVARY